jgi:hypothetical protein
MPSQRGIIFALIAPAISALPLVFNETEICALGRCDTSKSMKYERKSTIQPGYQWNDAGGYCGSWATQRAALNQGAWVSQQQVRDHTYNCGGHDTEILSCNIEVAWTNLKFDFNAFDYNNTKQPQTTAFTKWLKKQLLDGYVVAWMIMWSGQAYPIYNLSPPAGMYGHVEPVIGIQSNHPLSDETVYDDDVILHYTDGGTETVQRVISTLPCKWNGPGDKADCGDYHYGIGNPYGFGFSLTGFTGDARHASSTPAVLTVQPFLSEPDTRSGKKPELLRGTLTMASLTKGKSYDIYRWDSVKDSFTYTTSYKKTNFKAAGAEHTYVDDVRIHSNGTTYYRVVSAA